jgi:hypothetical protein
MVSLENERRWPYGFGPIVLVFSAMVTGVAAVTLFLFILDHDIIAP